MFFIAFLLTNYNIIAYYAIIACFCNPILFSYYVLSFLKQHKQTCLYFNIHVFTSKYAPQRAQSSHTTPCGCCLWVLHPDFTPSADRKSAQTTSTLIGWSSVSRHQKMKGVGRVSVPRVWTAPTHWSHAASLTVAYTRAYPQIYIWLTSRNH